MPYPKFEGLVPNGKRIDWLLGHGQLVEAELLLRAAERDLTVRRKNRGQRLLRFPSNSRQHKIDKAQMALLNMKLGLICNTLRKRNGVGWRAAKIRARLETRRRIPRTIRRR